MNILKKDDIASLSKPENHIDYDSCFELATRQLKSEGRYRVFNDIERHAGDFPKATSHSTGGEITIWCSNDYLGMGQHPKVREGDETCH